MKAYLTRIQFVVSRFAFRLILLSFFLLAVLTLTSCPSKEDKPEVRPLYEIDDLTEQRRQQEDDEMDETDEGGGGEQSSQPPGFGGGGNGIGPFI